MTNFKKLFPATILGAALALGVAAGGLSLNNATASAEENDGIMTVSHTPEAPTFGSPKSYYCAVAYPIIDNDTHEKCNTVYLKSAPSASGEFALTYYENKVDGSILNDDTRYYIVHATKSSTSCSPLYKYASAYCSECGAYSNAAYLSASESSTFKCTDYTAQYTTISTSYTTNCTWTYSGTVGQNCFFTLAYNGYIANDSQKMTASEVQYSYVLDGVTFYIKISNSSIKIKASKTVVTDIYNTMFAFYVYG